MEVRKQNGEHYPAKTLYLLASGILRYFRDCGLIDVIFLNNSNDRFLHVRRCLDSQMKWVTKQGFGSEIKQAEPITADHEAKLWSSGVFGYDSAKSLQNAVFFYNCILFGMRGRDEHHDLETSQFTIGEDENGRYIQFIGRSNKTYKGGLKDRSVQNKNIKHYSGENERNILRLFGEYLNSLGTQGSSIVGHLKDYDLVSSH